MQTKQNCNIIYKNNITNTKESKEAAGKTRTMREDKTEKITFYNLQNVLSQWFNEA